MNRVMRTQPTKQKTHMAKTMMMTLHLFPDYFHIHFFFVALVVKEKKTH
jgi:hypothetical protein